MARKIGSLLRENGPQVNSLGLSGERPLLLVHAGVPQGLGLLRTLAPLLREWARGGVACDVVVLSHEAHSYLIPVQRELTQLIEQHAAEREALPEPAPTGLHLLRQDALTPEQLATLCALARVQLRADGQVLLHQVRAWTDGLRAPAQTLWSGQVAPHAPLPLHGAQADPGAAPFSGQFEGGGSRFAFEVGAG